MLNGAGDIIAVGEPSNELAVGMFLGLKFTKADGESLFIAALRMENIVVYTHSYRARFLINLGI